VPVVTPPPPRIDEQEIDKLVDELQALIEEARRRARRRRRFIAAVVVAAAAAGAAALLHGGGAVTFGRSVADASNAPAAASDASDGWGASHGPDGAFVVSFASAPKALYAGTIGSGIFGSPDGGRSWRALGLGGMRIDALAVDPVRPATVYAGTGDGVFKTIDSGRSWRRASRGLFKEHPPDGRRHRLIEGYVSGLAIDPRKPATVYATTWGGTYRSVDAGRSWRRFVLPGGGAVSQIAFARDEPVVLAEIAEHDGIGFARSTDGGRTWSPLSLRRPRFGAGALAFDPRDARTVYLPIGHRGLLKSTDGGASWRRIYDREVVSLTLDPAGTLYLATTTALVASRDGGESWNTLGIDLRRDEHVWLLAADPSWHDVVYAASAGRILRSVDGGATWIEATRGLRASRVAALAAAQNDLYAAAGTGLFRSVDAGATWRPLDTGAVPTAVAVDPTRPETLYMATAASGVFRSDDRGTTWRATHGLTRRRIEALAADEGGRLYAAMLGGGIVTSDDRGLSWRPTRVRGNSFALTVAGGTAYGATANGGVWRTEDGPTWTKQGHVCCGRVNALAADLADPDVVYAGNGFGIFRSDDGGVEWRHVGPAGVQVQALAIDPRSSRTVYAGTWGGAGVYRSTDGGATWEPFADGLPPGAVGGTSFAAGVGSFAFSADGRRLFAGTLGNGVVRRSRL
jgi:hypothetical protein